MKSEVKSQRNDWFFFGSQQQIEQLKYMSGYGPFACDTQVLL